jgi:hypothetical protein
MKSFNYSISHKHVKLHRRLTDAYRPAVGRGVRSGRIWREMEVRRLRIRKIRIHENWLADERMDILPVILLPFFKPPFIFYGQ